MFYQTMTDVAALILSYYAAMYLRFRGVTEEWQWQFYNTWFVISVFITILQLHVRSLGNRSKKITKQDPIELIAESFRTVAISMMILVGMLFVLQQSWKISRLMLGYWSVLYFIVDTLSRFVFQRLVRVHESQLEAKRRILLITTSPYKNLIEKQLREEAGRENDTAFIGTVLLDESAPSLQSDLAKAFNITEVYLYLPSVDHDVMDKICMSLADQDLQFFVGLGNNKEFYFEDRLQSFGKSVAVQYPQLNQKCEVLRVNFNVASPGKTVAFIRKNINRLRGKYVTLCNVHTTVTAYEDENYRRVQNAAVLTLPDGAPIAKIQKLRGFRDAQRVAGPDLMEWMFEATMDGRLSHYFYGSTEETLDLLEKNLNRKYPGINIRGMYSPPFRALTPEEEAADIERINASGADLIWIGLGAPKQELWMARNAGKLNGLMLGVGAGFNFHAGTVKRAPKWVQRIGMEWLHRLLQEPKKLFKRYFVTNTKFFIYLLKER